MSYKSPQLDNGYTKIANEIMEALIKFRIPGEQRQCLDFIIRKTYGFNKLDDRISNSQFCIATGLKKGNVSRSIKSLVDKKVVIKNDNTLTPTYRFNKKYNQWKVLSKKQPVIKKETVVIKSDKKPLSKVMDTKERNKLLQKKQTAFLLFWNIYPKKVGRAEAEKSWLKIESNDYDKIMLAINNILPTWAKTEKKFIPNPSTWLNQKRWDDEIDSGQNSAGPNGLSGEVL